MAKRWTPYLIFTFEREKGIEQLEKEVESNNGEDINNISNNSLNEENVVDDIVPKTNNEIKEISEDDTGIELNIDDIQVENTSDEKQLNRVIENVNTFAGLHGYYFKIVLSNDSFNEGELLKFITDYINYIQREAEYNRIIVYPKVSVWWVINTQDTIIEDEFKKVYDWVLEKIYELSELEVRNYFFFILKRREAQYNYRELTHKYAELAILINNNNLFWNYDGYTFNKTKKQLSSYAINIIITIEESSKTSLLDIAWKHSEFSKEKQFFTVGTSRNLLYGSEEERLSVHKEVVNAIKDIKNSISKKIDDYKWEPKSQIDKKSVDEFINSISSELSKDYYQLNNIDKLQSSDTELERLKYEIEQNMSKLFINLKSNIKTIELFILTELCLQIINKFYEKLDIKLNDINDLKRQEDDIKIIKERTDKILKDILTQSRIEVDNFFNNSVLKRITNKIDDSIDSKDISIIKQFAIINKDWKQENLEILFPEEFDTVDIIDVEDGEEKMSRYQNVRETLYSENVFLNFVENISWLRKIKRKAQKKFFQTIFTDADKKRLINTILFKLIKSEIKKFISNVNGALYTPENLVKTVNFEHYLTLRNVNVAKFLDYIEEQEYTYNLDNSENISDFFKELKDEMYNFITSRFTLNNQALNLSFDILPPLYSNSEVEIDKVSKHNLIIIGRKKTGAKEISEKYKKKIGANIDILDNFPFDEAKLSIFGPWS